MAVLSALASPAAAMLAAVGLATVGALGFAATPASRRWRGAEHEVSLVGPLAAAGVRTLFLALAGFGTVIGALHVAVPAFAAERGSAEAGGFFLAALSAGSLCGGLVSLVDAASYRTAALAAAAAAGGATVALGLRRTLSARAA